MNIHEVDFIRHLQTLEADIAGAMTPKMVGNLKDRIEIAVATAQENFSDNISIKARLGYIERRFVSLTQRVQAEEVVDVEVVRDTFYNMMVEEALHISDLTREDTPRLLSAYTLLEIIQRSRQVTGLY